MSVKSFSLNDLALLLDAELVGDGNKQITALADLSSATADAITFVSSAKYAPALGNCQAGAVVLQASEAELFAGNKLISKQPYLCYAKLSALFATRRARQPGIHATATVHPSAQLGNNVAVGPNVVIGEDAIIGDDTELYAGVCVGDQAQIGARSVIFNNVVIYHQVQIGSDAIIHANTTIGSDGFGFSPSVQGWKKIHQLGRVIIGDRVEIGANTSIDRGALGDTVIEDGVIIDNQVHLAHNVKIGAGSAIAGCVGIAGSTSLGENCQVAGMVAINGHIDIASGTYFHGGTVVTRGNSEPGQFASATPMQDVKSWRKNSVRYRQLDELFDRVKKLEKQLAKTEKN